MSDDSMVKKVIQGLGDLGEETGKEALRQTKEMVTSIISPQDLLGGIRTMSESEIQQKKMEDEKKKQEELAKLQAQMSGQGRNVEQEMEQVRQEKEQIEEQQEKEEEKRVMEEQRTAMMTVPAPEPVGRPSRGMMGGGHKKKQQPTDDQMTATAEFKGKVD